jgi:hypothetical protein
MAASDEEIGMVEKGIVGIGVTSSLSGLRD